ncbi:MAG: hypothetical protein ABFR75_11655 [Acidobacteriota bacterium]
MKNRINDNDIKLGVKSLNFDIPSDVVSKVNNLIVEREQTRNYFWKHINFANPFIKWAPAYLTLFLVLIMGTFPLKKDPDLSKLTTEIKIEYELKDKNIKILWVKKQNFLLRRLKK